MKKVFIGLFAFFVMLSLLVSDKIQKEDTGNNREVLQKTKIQNEYLWGMHAFHDDRVKNISNEDLILAGENTCTLLDEGYPIANVALDMAYTEKSLNKDIILANEVLANAVFTMCKQFIPELNDINP